MSDLLYWLWLSLLPLSPHAARRYVLALGSARALYLAGEGELGYVEGALRREVQTLCRKDLSQAETVEARCRELGVQILCLPDSAYPDRLRNIPDPPVVLYVRGTLPPVDERLCIGLVGTRKAGAYGQDLAGRIAGELASCGAVIVTGLAQGIDSAAARSALKAGGKVVAVLGTGIDRVFPAGNEALQDAVAASGAVVTEFPPGTSATRYTFPRRNRVISGLSVGVTVVEAPAKSGALITAGFARDQGRDVFVVPGAVDDPGFIGSNSLIRDGAQLIRGSADILEEYRGRFSICPVSAPVSGDVATKEAIDKASSVDYSSLTEQLEDLTEQELKLVTALAGGAAYADELIRRSGLPSPETMAGLTMLQLKGYVREEYGKYRLIVQTRGPAQA